jgi:aspartate/glutamate racemase
MDATVGVIGGMGNEAMADLAENMAGRPESDGRRFVLYGNSRQAFTPAEAGGDWAAGDPPLRRKRRTGEFTAAVIHSLGADVAGLACNDQHPLFREIYAESGANFVDMIDETAATAAGDDGALVLGTKRTLDQRLYDERLERHGVSAYQPTPENRTRLMNAIYDPEYGIKTGQITSRARAQLCEVVTTETERHGVRNVVLGCTELPLLFSADRITALEAAGHVPSGLRFLDPTDVLARALVNAAPPSESVSPPDPTAFVGEFCDYHPPFACAVDDLSRAADVQSELIERTEAYFERQGKSVTGSYTHLPTLFLVGYERPVSLPNGLDVPVRDPADPGFGSAMRTAIAENYDAVAEYL